MRVLMISYASLIQELYHGKPRALAALPDIQLSVLVPPSWKELWSDSVRDLEVKSAISYRIEVAGIVFNGNLHLAFFREKIGPMIRMIQPDIIDIEDEPFNAGSAQAIFLRNRFSPQSRIVMHASQTDLKRYPPPFNVFERYSLRNTSAFLARSGEARDVLKAKGFRGMIEVISHGIDPGKFVVESRVAKKSLGLEGLFVVGFIGSLVHQKGIDLLLKSARELDCRVLIVGEGPEREALKILGDNLGISDRLTIHPAVPHGEIPRFMAAMDVFVLPSRTAGNWREKFGRVLLEAMAAGVPIVGSSSGEIPRVIGDAGLVFQEGDVESLTSCVRKLRDDQVLRRKLSEKGRDRVEQEYSWSRIAARTYRVYQKVLDT